MALRILAVATLAGLACLPLGTGCKNNQPTGAACNEDTFADCGAGNRCSGGVCRWCGPSAECRDAHDCCPGMGSDLACLQGRCCAPPNVLAGCSVDSDCCAGRCEQGLCCAAQKGAFCERDEQCCPSTGLVCDTATHACATKLCLPNAGKCAKHADCCSHACKAGACCRLSGDDCASDGDCCDGACDLAAKLCKLPPACAALGAPCASDANCCSAHCKSGAPAVCCNPPDGACSSDADCCQGLACNAAKKCAPASCASTSAPCTKNAECCSQSCVGMPMGCGCSGAGFGCNSPADCCTPLTCDFGFKTCK